LLVGLLAEVLEVEACSTVSIGTVVGRAIPVAAPAEFENVTGVDVLVSGSFVGAGGFSSSGKIEEFSSKPLLEEPLRFALAARTLSLTSALQAGNLACGGSFSMAVRGLGGNSNSLD
jgi:hypothetical protein